MEEKRVQPIAGILTRRPELLPEIALKLEPAFGPMEMIGAWLPFDHTTYYEEEMGSALVRCFVSFVDFLPADGAYRWKAQAVEVERAFARGETRLVNIDPGYLDANKVVLISGKYGGHKICLAPSVYADLLLWYHKGWQALPWAFPDFRDGSLFPLFVKMRTALKAKLRNLSS